MKYCAFIGKSLNPVVFNTRLEAVEFIAKRHSILPVDVDMDEQICPDPAESRTWEVSDSRGDDLVILGYVVEV